MIKSNPLFRIMMRNENSAQKIMNHIVVPQNTTLLKALEETVSVPIYKNLANKWLETRFLKLSDEGNFDPSGLQKILDEFGPTVEQLFKHDKDLLADMRKIAELGRLSPEIAGGVRSAQFLGAGGKITSTLTQAAGISAIAGTGAAGGIAFGLPGLIIGTGGAIILANTAAKMFSNAFARKLIIKGMTTPATAPGFADIANKLLSLSVVIQARENSKNAETRKLGQSTRFEGR